MNSDSLQLNTEFRLCAGPLNERLLYKAGKSPTVHYSASVADCSGVGFPGSHLTHNPQRRTLPPAAPPWEQRPSTLGDWGSANASSAPQTRRLHTSLLRNVNTNLLSNLLLKLQFVFYPKLERLKITHEGSLSNKISSVLPNTSATAVGLLKYLLFCPNPHTNKMLPYTTKIPKEIIMLWLRHFIGIWEIQDHSFLCRRCPLDPMQTTSQQFVPPHVRSQITRCLV